MIPQLVLMGLLAAPAPAPSLNPAPTLQVTPSLTIEARFLERGERAPQPGFFLERGPMRLLLAEAAQAGPACDTRLEAQRTLCTEQLAANTAACEERLQPMAQRISELQGLEESLRASLAERQRRLYLWKMGSSVAGGVALSAITYLLVVR
jgi:hypothetical protein